jgi:predicted porin
MNKKLLAVAVAGALAAPLGAYAQSTVTITGTFKGSFESYKYGNSVKANASSTAVVDDSSQIVFRVVEDLGGGMSAVAQLDVRFKPDDPGGTPAALSGANTVSTNIGSGNTWYGLQSKAWGRIVMGRQDIHYFNTESDIATLGSLRANPVSLLAFAGGGGTAIARASRTQNIIHYLSPNWGGFTMIAGYSSNPTGQDADIGSGVRKGSAWVLNPNMQGSNYQIGYSYYTEKQDATTGSLGTGNQRGDRLYGSYKWSGFKFGLAFDKSRIKSGTTGVTLSNRTAWSFPLSYTWGNHSVHGHYTKAKDDSAIAGDNSAKMIAAGYAYKLSARTSAAVTYVRVANAAAAFYQPFTSSALGSTTAGTAAIAADEDPRLWSLTLRHTF